MRKKQKRLTLLFIPMLLLGFISSSTLPASAASYNYNHKSASDYMMLINPKTKQELDDILDQMEEDLVKPSSYYSNSLNDH
ncbi:hypothetical protein ACWV26_08245 [Rummeliibacillus sp. JY-2-4R]